MPDPFSPALVQKAIERLAIQASSEIKLVRKAATAKGLSDLVAACDEELGRRPYDVDADTAVSIQRSEEETEGMTLAEAVRHAFTKVRPPSDDEVRYLRWQAVNPGGSYAEAVKVYGKGDLGLCIGHLVYDRYGCFRRFIDDKEDQSSVLIEKVRGQGSVRYTLRPEVQQALQAIGVV